MSERDFEIFSKYLKVMFIATLFIKIVHDRSLINVYSICARLGSK